MTSNNRYARLSMPKTELELLRHELWSIRAPDLQMTEGQRTKLLARFDAAHRGRDLRVINGARPKGRRMAPLDVRRDPAA